MKRFIVGKVDERCPFCGNQKTITYYGEPGTIYVDSFPRPSFVFCWQCADQQEDKLNRVRRILMMGDNRT